MAMLYWTGQILTMREYVERIETSIRLYKHYELRSLSKLDLKQNNARCLY
jgi:hypothetical protein